MLQTGFEIELLLIKTWLFVVSIFISFLFVNNLHKYSIIL